MISDSQISESLSKKIEIVRKNKDPALAALESVTDRIYDYTDTFLNKEGNLMTAKLGDYRAQQYFLNLREDAKKYESVRSKLLNDNFDLSLSEVNYVALSFFYCEKNLQDQADAMLKAASFAHDLYEELTEKIDIKT